MKTAYHMLLSKIRIIGSMLLVAITMNPATAQTTPRDTVVDFDGDGKTDIAIMRSAGIGATYAWWIRNSSNGEVTTFNFGVRPRDVPAPADYDGDGKDDVAMWRNTPEAGQVSAFYIIYSSTGLTDIIPFGQTGDVPVVEDYDGDGKDDLSVWRANNPAQGPGQATWFVKYSANNEHGNITYIPWGMRYGSQADQVDEPYPGDFDGDGRADFTVQRRVDISVVSSATPGMFITQTAAGDIRYQYFGHASDRILPGDYDGDGKTDIAVARGFNINPGQTTWYIRYSSGIPDLATVFGSGFNFAQGDYDGDGKTDIAYFMLGTNPGETGFWYLSSAAGMEGRFIPWGTRPTAPLAAELPIAGYNNR
jgi:spore coat protein A, manganese oxidase